MGFFGKSSVLQTLLALCFFTSSVFSTAPGSVTHPIREPFNPPSALLIPPPLPPVIKTPPLPPPVIKTPPLPPPVIKTPPLPPPVIKTPPLPPPVTKTPPLPPVSPPEIIKKLVAVRGMVYCKACKYATVKDPKPVKDAIVRFVCKHLKKPLETKTDKNGFFMFFAPNTVTTLSIKYCKAYLVKSPDAKCSKVSNLDGKIGSFIKPVPKSDKPTVIINKLTYALFNVGPFAFEPTSCPK